MSSQTQKRQFKTSHGSTKDPQIGKATLSKVDNARVITTWLQIILQNMVLAQKQTCRPLR